ncbi:MAG: hypothetical protein K0U52_04315 [Gammaproteobacteria bacterium]|nr:hypothetical protein [Gammaproteobacteria bacterium]
MPIDREHDLTLKELWEPGLTNLLGQKPKDLLAAGIKPLAQQAREAEAPKTKKEGKKTPKEVRWDKAEVRIEHKPPKYINKSDIDSHPHFRKFADTPATAIDEDNEATKEIVTQPTTTHSIEKDTDHSAFKDALKRVREQDRRN